MEREPLWRSLVSRGTIVLLGGLFIAGGFWFDYWPVRLVVWGFGTLIALIGVSPQKHYGELTGQLASTMYPSEYTRDPHGPSALNERDKELDDRLNLK